MEQRVNEPTSINTAADAVLNQGDSSSVNNKQQELTQQIEILQAKLSNIKIFVAVPMSMLMIFYFFTFAMLIDKGQNGALYFEIISSIAFIYALIKLNPLGFWLLKKRFAKHPTYAPILQQLDMDGIAKDAEQIAERLLRA